MRSPLIAYLGTVCFLFLAVQGINENLIAQSNEDLPKSTEFLPAGRDEGGAPVSRFKRGVSNKVPGDLETLSLQSRDAAIVSTSSNPDDAYWIGGFGDVQSRYQPGLVYSLATYNSQLVAAGKFDSAGNTAVSNIAAWDGTQWLPLDTGVDISPVFNLVVYDGKLFASGYGGVAQWDGNAWALLPSSPNNIVGLVVFNNELVGGSFWYSDTGTATFKVAAWNGATWRDIAVANDVIFDLIVWRGELYCSGRFTTIGSATAMHVARWDGNQWFALGSGLDDITRRLYVHNDTLVAGGQFTHAGGSPAEHIAGWDGSNWFAFGNGLNAYVRAMASFDGQLFACGSFTRSGSDTVKYIGVWDGSQWAAVDGGFDHTTNVMLSDDSQLIAGGWMSNNNGLPLVGIGSWDGSGWQTLSSGMRYLQLGGSSEVWTIISYHEKIIATGAFAGVPGQPEAMNIAAWDSANGWSCLGTGLNGTGRSLAIFDDKLIVGGDFTTAGDVLAREVAVWDGNSWSTLSGDPLPLYNSGGIDALCVFNGSLIVPNLQWAGGVPMNGIGAWNGTDWSPLPPNTAYIDNFAVYENELLASGSAGVQRWHGSTWEYLGGFPDWGICLLMYGDSLLAGGFNGLRLWTGAEWIPFAGGIGGSVVQLDENNGYLIVGGEFSQVGDTPANNIAVFDGAGWAPLGSGTNGAVYATATFDNRLWVGGKFTAAGTKPNYSLACWSKPLNCCVGVVGNADGDPGDGVDISDLQVYIDYLFFGGTPAGCPDEFDTSGNDNTVDISDLQTIIDYLFFGSSLTACPPAGPNAQPTTAGK